MSGVSDVVGVNVACGRRFLIFIYFCEHLMVDYVNFFFFFALSHKKDYIIVEEIN